jgi:hypothetical protein
VVYYFTQLPSAGYHNATTGSTFNTATGVTDYNLCTTPTLAHGAVRRVHTTCVTCFDTNTHTHTKLEAISKQQYSVKAIRKIPSW